MEKYMREQECSHDKSAAEKVLERAKKIDRTRKKNGWRYVSLTERIQLYVPCDKFGNPTREGNAMIKAYKNAL